MKLTDINPISSAITQGVEGLANGVANIVDRFKLTPDEKIAAKKEWQHLLQQHELALIEASNKQDLIHQQDRDSARKLQIAALQQQSWLPKNYIYILASVVVLGAFSFLIALFFVTIPEDNKRMVEMFADMFLFAGALMVLNYFFGSSSGSSRKTDMLASRTGKATPDEEQQQPPPQSIDDLLLTKRERRRKLSE